MPIAVKCPACGHQFSLPDALAGRPARCTRCATVIPAPGRSPPPPAPPAFEVVETPASEPEPESEAGRFRCPACALQFHVPDAAVGKAARCPRCATLMSVPAPPPPPPPPAFEVVDTPAVEPIRFPCDKCKVQLRADPSQIGRAVVCPKCGQRTLVPEQEEVGTFDLGKKEKRQVATMPPLASWWPDGGREKLPPSWRTGLATAREHVQGGRWKDAVAALHGLHQRAKRDQVRDGVVLRRPLAFCLGRWGAHELDRIADTEELSRPVRRVLKQAWELQRWGGTFNTFECPVCEKRLANLIGTTQLRTTAGSAYLCCAAPTRGDTALMERVHTVWKKLTLATGLDPENPELPDVMARLPKWYRAVDLGGAVWTRSIRETTYEGAAGSGGGLMGYIVGDMVGEAVGHALGQILFG